MPATLPPTAQELDELLCFDLYAAQRAVTAAYRPVLGPLGLTYPQYLVLVVLWGRGECAVRDVAAALRLDHGTLTPLLRRMETAGLITRTRGADDERTVLLRLTPAGDALRVHRDDVQCRIADAVGLHERDFVTLQRLLRRVTDATHAALEDDDL
ncbi:MarR family winged helix-turn-helix transcriptional regulator [Nocardioides rubriscoriae]|uniref:MarR family winged helix-turn-helix transcriptional regulator n=1 Tax=Nocardioides rubriscoriae TaxID=642762 RepID=UPI0011DF720B|nr:MarR family transcriptional regulator [Nocardioides rubriscoriae]